jgi:biotin carboxylase
VKKNKTILFIGAGIETIPGIVLAKKMGLHVIVSDSNPNAPGVRIADESLLASTYDISGTLSAVQDFHTKKHKIDGVICLGTDVPLTVATIANKLKLPGVSIESAKLSMNKFSMKHKFLEHGVTIPWFEEVKSAKSLKSIVNSRENQLVIKPIDSRGARGVLRIDNSVDIEWAFSIAKSNSPSGRVMVEAFLDGPQVSTESIIIDGKCYTPGFSDRNYEYLHKYAPNIIENGGDLPSSLPDSACSSIRDLISKAAEAMGVKNGTLKGDVVLHNNKPYIIEVATRLSGGYFCTHEIPLNTGIDFVGHAIRQALGQNINALELVPKYSRGVSQRYFFPKPGRVTKIEVPDWVKSDPDVELFELRVKVGDIVMPAHNHPSRAGLVIATGSNREHAMEKSKSVIDSVIIETNSIP